MSHGRTNGFDIIHWEFADSKEARSNEMLGKIFEDYYHAEDKDSFVCKRKTIIALRKYMNVAEAKKQYENFQSLR